MTSLSATQTLYVTIFLLTIGIFVLMMSSTFIVYGAARTVGSTKRVSSFAWFFIAFTALWAGVALAVSASGLISFRLVLPFVLFPVTLGTLALFTGPVTSILREIPSHWLIYLQVYRVAGGVFIFPYLTEGVLTRGFALNAGIGDVLTGVFAIPVAYLVQHSGKNY